MLFQQWTYACRGHDEESGVIYYSDGHYNPEIGRFLQNDPHPGKLVIPAPMVAAYTYCANNPWNFKDPSGEIFGIDDLLFLGIAIVEQNANENNINIDVSSKCMRYPTKTKTAFVSVFTQIGPPLKKYGQELDACIDL